MKKILVGMATLAFLNILTVQAEAITVASDIMDEAGTLWSLGVTQYPFQHGTVEGIAPTAGSDTMHFNTSQVIYSGTNFITFSGVKLAIGDYLATFDVGNYVNRAWPTNIGPVGMTAGGTIITPVSTNTPVPASGGTLQWSYSYSIGAADPLLGLDIGFSISVPYSNELVESNVAFDNLIIDFSSGTANPVPEPATMLLFGTGLAGLAAVGRRKRS